MYLYWVSAITYALVLSIILYSDIRATKNPGSLEKSYRVMCTWVIFFCMQDMLWGLCESGAIGSSTVFFVSSGIFHMSTVITTFFWLKYVLDYLAENLGKKIRYKKLFLVLDGVLILGEFVLVVLNCFTTTLFQIVDGRYVTGRFRPLTFVNQYIVYLAIGVATLVLAFKNKMETKTFGNYRTVFLFAQAPIVLGVFQLLYPDGPFYSLGYFLGCFIIHIFVISHDREVYLSKEEKLQRILELNRELEKKQAKIDDQFSILRSISGAFDYINLVDLDTQTASRFDVRDDAAANRDHFDLANDPHTSLNKKIAPLIDEAFRDRYLEYTDLSKLDRKMRGKRSISSEFKYTDGGWISALYIRVGDNVNKPISKVAYVLRNITADRKREEQVYGALTNLVYSLHIFDLENDTMERLIESDIFKQIVGTEESAQRMSSTIIRATCKDEYLDIMLEFVDLSTVSRRMKGKNSLNIEFVGKYHGWTRMTFIPIERDARQVRKMLVATEIIDSEKNELMNLIYKSSTDELTRLYNRRMYEEELEAISASGSMEDLVIVALDLNGLKTVNDTLGHRAGDELIIGAGNCVRESFCSVGKSYRTGGDEFTAILRCDKKKLPAVFAEFERNMEAWTGTMVESLSISYGYAAAADEPGHTVSELTALADKRMYEAKSAYYVRKGLDRRRT